MKKRLCALALSAALLLTLAACGGETSAAAPPTASALSDADYDAADATAIVFSGDTAAVTGDGASAEGAVVTVDTPGTYLISGETDDGGLVVDADDDVHLVLSGASLTSASGCPLLVQSGDVTLTLADGTDNSLADAADYSLEADGSTVDAALFCKDDLVINGGGSLAVTGSLKHGIVSKDALTVADGTVTVTAAEDGINVNDSVAVTGGSLTISAGDDGIHSDGTLDISGGAVTVTQSNEGLEGTVITLSGGTVLVTSSDDGLNASDGSSSDTGFGGGMASGDDSLQIVISGGYTVVNAGGDGLDSNGKLVVTGGVTLVSGPTDSNNGALDYGTSAEVTGGVLIAAGSDGMAESFGEDSTQGSIMTDVGSQSGGTPVALVDEDGTVLCSFTPMKDYANVVVTCPGITADGTYTLQTGTVSGADDYGYAENAALTDGTVLATVTMTALQYSEGGMSGGFGGGGTGGGFGGGQGGGPGGGGTSDRGDRPDTGGQSGDVTLPSGMPEMGQDGAVASPPASADDTQSS